MHTTFSMAQVGRYDSPANSTFGNTYVSPNYDALLQLGTIAKQRQIKIQELIKRTITTYNSYPRYPQKIKEGWHQAVCLCQEENLLMEVEAYVNVNNEITTIDLGTQTAKDIKIKIVNGKAELDGLVFYFLEDIWQYNKDY